MNRTIRLETIPRRIISLVPSQTELLYDLGLTQEVIGITKFCVHPETFFRSKARIGGTKKLNIEKIRLLKPDLIIGNKEENERAQIEELMQDYPVWMSDIKTLPDALQMISMLGEITGRIEVSSKMTDLIEERFAKIPSTSPYRRVAYFIWRNPWMVAGPGTFINDLLERCGLVNAFQEHRYPIISTTRLAEAAPTLILLSSEPYPFQEKHFAEFRSVCPNAEIRIVDGELFSWYGSRLLLAPAYFQKLLSGE
jgi:ABC-type Fe3+-hydroxamate transport system substrate-binding protein